MKVLIVCGNKGIRERAERFFRSRGFAVEGAHAGGQGFSRALSGRFSLAVIDPETAGWGGSDRVSSLLENRPLLRVLLVAQSQGKKRELRELFRGTEQIVGIVGEEDLAAGRVPEAAVQKELLRFRRAKIVATLGPSSCEEQVLRSLLEAGVNVVRVNFSHGERAWHRHVIERVRTVAGEMGRTVAVLGDLAGPKIRVTGLATSEVVLERGAKVTITDQEHGGTARCFGISLPDVLGDLIPGDRVLLDDGNLELLVEHVGDRSIRCGVVHGGVLKEHKGVNLPGASLRLPALTEKDRQDLAFAIEEGLDFVAVSFVREARHIVEVKDIVARSGAELQVIAKIEKPEAVANLEQIMAVADGVMIARGDLGVELAAVRVPHMQRSIIRLARRMGKPVITATQMLESMVLHPRPTRAEVADVSNAVEEGTDAVMLSAETAAGNYPVLAVQTMASIVAETESWIREAPNPYLSEERRWGLVPALSRGLALVADAVDLPVIAVATRSGRTVLSLSKTHPDAALVALSDRDAVLRRVCLYHGVVPARVRDMDSEEAIVRAAEKAAVQHGLAGAGAMIAVLWDPEWRGGARGSLAVRFRRIEAGR